MSLLDRNAPLPSACAHQPDVMTIISFFSLVLPSMWTFLNSIWFGLFLNGFFSFNFIYLFLERGEGREKERDRDPDVREKH